MGRRRHLGTTLRTTRDLQYDGPLQGVQCVQTLVGVGGLTPCIHTDELHHWGRPCCGGWVVELSTLYGGLHLVMCP